MAEKRIPHPEELRLASLKCAMDEASGLLSSLQEMILHRPSPVLRDRIAIHYEQLGKWLDDEDLGLK